MIKYTDLKSTNRQNLREILPLPKPFTVLVEPSSLCNFRCIQCFQSLQEETSFSRSRKNMPMTRFRRILKQLLEWEGPRLKVLKLSLYGEPLVNPDFCDMIRLAKEAGVAERVETTTNASLLTREIAEKMVRFQLDYARVSIYATDQRRHEEVTGSTVLLSTIRENLRLLRETKIQQRSERPFVSAKMLDSFGEENERFLRLFQDVTDEVYIDKPHSWIKTGSSDFLKNYYQEALGKALADLHQHSTRRIACPMPFTTMAIRSNGDIAPCCVDFIGGTTLGNVEELDLRDLWNSERWFEFQKMQLENRKHENSSCARCDVYLSDHYTRDDIDGFPVENLRKKNSPSRD
ncbi:MAG: radical SAM protein [Candidatus Riflebacteria bacterium]|nr:radical SAM protein [Candidatus Riflebacteria bacterium]